ncbi:MAG: hypothetical protein AAF579_03450 [Cyanobacteria bacterium P01_C01_bin.118]
MTSTTQNRKKSFSSFSYKDAVKYLGITELKRWQLEAKPVPISDFFQQRLDRLQRFDLESLEISKTLLIDAICEEGLEEIPQLKVWKGAYLEGKDVCGNADYLIAERRAYLEAPFVCVIEAKKDDFEQGAAQCLVEMAACRWNNHQIGRDIDSYGIVTNGEGWKFYRLATNGEVSESLLTGIGDMPMLLGRLRSFFKLCGQNL